MNNGNDALAALYNEEETPKDKLRIHIYLKDVLKRKGVSQKELAEMTGIRPAAISELANNMRSSINREHIEIIAEALNLQRLDELIRFDIESELWNMTNRDEQYTYINEKTEG